MLGQQHALKLDYSSPPLLGASYILICLLAPTVAPRCRQCAGTTGGQTPLMCAAKGASVEALKILLAHGADVHAVDDEGRTGTQ